MELYWTSEHLAGLGAGCGAGSGTIGEKMWSWEWNDRGKDVEMGEER